MSSPELKKLMEERNKLLFELLAFPHMVHGSILERYNICSRPNCKCHHGQKHGPFLCIVVNENGKQRQKYIPKIMRDFARMSVEEHKRVLEIIDRISDINLKLLQAKEYG